MQKQTKLKNVCMHQRRDCGAVAKAPAQLHGSGSSNNVYAWHSRKIDFILSVLTIYIWNVLLLYSKVNNKIDWTKTEKKEKKCDPSFNFS